MKKKLVVSFSGGRTSGYMTKWLIDNKQDEYEFVIIFANTGQEHEKTLEFINNCDKHFGFNTVWVESVVHNGERKGTTHKIVSFETASRNGEPFEEVIKKYGIPNMAFPHCTRELKLAPIYSYIREIGWSKKQRYTAIGIRNDENRRVRKDAVDAHIIYPLIDMIPTDKQDVLDWWKEQDFDLGISEHHGNCTWCWKKSIKKHMMLIDEMPDIFNFPRSMENLYPHNGSHKDKTIPRTFFRGNKSTDALFEIHKLVGSEDIANYCNDNGVNTCSESCEMYQMELI